jgi:hypothetical protein
MYFNVLLGGIMSKKHYIMLASILKGNNAEFTLCTNMAVEFKKDNQAFDIERFLSACGYPSNDSLLPVLPV